MFWFLACLYPSHSPSDRKKIKIKKAADKVATLLWDDTIVLDNQNRIECSNLAQIYNDFLTSKNIEGEGRVAAGGRERERERWREGQRQRPNKNQLNKQN